MNKKLVKLEALKDLVQDAIDKGATTVEQIHKTVADLPFSVLEKRGVLTEEAKGVRDLKDHTIGQVYDAIRAVNKEIGELATSLFEAAENYKDVDATLKKNDGGDSGGPQA